MTTIDSIANDFDGIIERLITFLNEEFDEDPLVVSLMPKIADLFSHDPSLSKLTLIQQLSRFKILNRANDSNYSMAARFHMLKLITPFVS